MSLQIGLPDRTRPADCLLACCPAHPGVWFENALNRLGEQPGDSERQREARIVPARFDRVDRLARYAESLRQVGLRPSALGAKLGQPISHR